jgi:hypothetical protein
VKVHSDDVYLKKDTNQTLIPTEDGAKNLLPYNYIHISGSHGIFEDNAGNIWS